MNTLQKPQAQNRLGKQTLQFASPPRVLSFASIVGAFEGEGRYANWFDMILDDDLYDTDSWEQAESKMFEQAVVRAIQKGNTTAAEVDVLLGGDLLNQIISANFAARQLAIPFMGLYGACSTMALSLLTGSMLINAQYASLCACATSSHFCSAERQYRFPLEYGNQRAPSAQRTVTGAGCTMLVQNDMPGSCVTVTHGTIGKVIDLGIKDAGAMGAAMAPAAADTLAAHFADTGRAPDFYQLIVTGDLGVYGSKLLIELLQEQGYDIKDRHFDCGEQIFTTEQNTYGGGSGCGCCAALLNSYLLKRMAAGKIQNILFAATGALLSPESTLLGESIPCISHAVSLCGVSD